MEASPLLGFKKRYRYLTVYDKNFCCKLFKKLSYKILV
jgi:hypothetical protein